jgi:hypothetical protein
MERAGRIGLLLGVLVVLAVGCLGWAAFHSGDSQECYACKRAMHAHSKTVAVADGRTRQFCCPACALAQHEQSGRRIQITELTSYSTGKALAPEKAYVLKGSDINMCVTKPEIIDADKHPVGMHYDRCAPSMLAFERRSEAEQVARRHGGTVSPFAEAARAFAK